MNSELIPSKSYSALEKPQRELLYVMERAALRAASHILKRLEEGPALASWRKFDDTVVTEADIESQAILVNILKGDLPLVCEESPESHKLLQSESNYFLIDPLDGTTSARRFGIQKGGQVGYGPIIGLVQDSRLFAAVFVNIPMRRAFSAVRDFGCESFSFEDREQQRTLLAPVTPRPIEKSALLFYAGKRGELDVLPKLRKNSALENYYRFGGFANDALRVALNHEQLQLQFSVKAWDLPAALLPHETGCKVILNPLGEYVELADYKPQLENPLLLGQGKLVDEVLAIIRAN